MTFDPLLPWPLVAGFALVAALFVALRLRRGGAAGPVLRSAALLTLTVAVALGPAVQGGRSEARRTAADVLFVVDATGSMAAEDFAGGRPRLDGVRADILELADAFPGAHFSLIRFAAQGRVELPWTTDLAALETAVGVIREERAVYSRGSQLTVPLEAMDHQVPRTVGADDRHTVVFYFSDGEETTPSTDAAPTLTEQTAEVFGEDTDSAPTVESFAELAPSIDGGAVLGYGTAQGGPMLEFVGRDVEAQIGGDPYVLDYSTGERAISRIDEANLRAVADDLGIAYLHRTTLGGLGGLAASIAEEAETAGAGARDAPRRLYWIPAVGVLIVVLWQSVFTVAEIVATQRALGSRRRRSAA